MVTLPVLRHLQQINQAKEARLSRQLWSNIRETDRLNRIDLDLNLFHSIPRAHFDTRPRPDSHTARNLAAPNSFAQPFGKNH
jgi:hypothetical protein